jgi:hypothetical protein
MTKLTKPVRREVSSLHHGLLIATLTEEGIYLRRVRSREGAKAVRRKKDGTEHSVALGFLLPWGLSYQSAARLHADRDRAERKRSRGRAR